MVHVYCSKTLADMDTCVLLLQIHVKAPHTCTHVHACIILTISSTIDHTHIGAASDIFRVPCALYRIAGNIGGELYGGFLVTLPILNLPISCQPCRLQEKAWRSYRDPPNLYPPIVIFILFLAIRQILFPPIYPAIRYDEY